MPVFSTNFTATYQTMVGDQFTLAGRTIGYYPIGARLINADRQNVQTLMISANLSAQVLQLGPLGVSAPAMMCLFLADQPCDIRTNAASDVVFLSGVQFMLFTGHLSGIFVTTGGADTTIHLEACGGSNAQLTTNLPLS